MNEHLGSGTVVRLEEPIYGGANGALNIAHDMPEEYWTEPVGLIGLALSARKPAPWCGFLGRWARVLRRCNRVLPLFSPNRSAMCRVCLCCGHGRENHRHRRTGDRMGLLFGLGLMGWLMGCVGAFAAGWRLRSTVAQGAPSPAPRGAAERQGGAPDLSPAPVRPAGRHSDPPCAPGPRGSIRFGSIGPVPPWSPPGSCPIGSRYPCGKGGAMLGRRSSSTRGARFAVCEPSSSRCWAPWEWASRGPGAVGGCLAAAGPHTLAASVGSLASLVPGSALPGALLRCSSSLSARSFLAVEGAWSVSAGSGS